MPKTFTHLCEKVNLSLFDNTLTVYPKQNRSFKPNNNRFFQSSSNMNYTNVRVGVLFMKYGKELGIDRFVHRGDPDHYLLHQDSFRPEDNHYHWMFAETIDESKLNEILDTLEGYALITSQEHNRCMRDYQMANMLPDSTETIKVSDASYLIPPNVEFTVEEKIAMNTRPQDRFNLSLY
ncbi:hypothetical protein [Legionella tunisiensis]|uniref:hypothetical protein n=1 Tax=Legionella tunisiensis TaxID=1034944 RepID=UPI0002D5C50C|nr:hypothetical protein [Legionella tunisiensis]